MDQNRREQAIHLRELLAVTHSSSSSFSLFERLIHALEAFESPSATYASYPRLDEDLRNLVLHSSSPSFLSLLKVLLPPGFGLYFSCSSDATALETVVVLTPRTRAAFDVREPNRPVPIPTDLDVVVRALDGTEDSLSPIFAAKEPCIISCAMELVQWDMDKSSEPTRKKLHLRWLRRLARSHGRLPLSFYLDTLRIESAQIRGGAYSDIYIGKFGTQQVCLKVLRIFQEDGHRQRVIKEFCHESLVWRQLQHPNVLPFLGVTETLFPEKFCLVSPWMRNGSVISFLKDNPTHDRLPFVNDIAKGLNYLHSFTPPIVHGDVRGANILVQDDLTCCLADLGLALVSESQSFTASSNASAKGTIRWSAPEIFTPDSFPNAPKEKRDVFAFACTIVEVSCRFHLSSY
ncbi:kinase-like domain-containing protein [Flagelloscypha sp. PMI_526]|nr:kinase-like domain-containing protein [Flagelloscypha sp. PMI_526]